MKFSRTLFAPCALLGFSCTAFTLLRFPCVPFRHRRVFGRPFAFLFGLIMLLGGRQGVRICFLAVPGDLPANPFLLKFALAPALGRSSGCKRHERQHDHNGDHDGDHGNR
jgi:hypothetical protein